MRFQHVLAMTLGLALAASVSAQTRPPAPAQPTQANLYPPALYQRNDVSKTLNLSQDQINALNKVTGQVQSQYRDDYKKLETLNEADRAARLRDLNRKYYADWTKGARDVFNDTQRTRYQQINYQYGGFNSLYDPDVQKRLGLTERQIRDLREQSDWSNRRWQEINRLGATDPTKAATLYNDYWKTRDERFNKFLTPEQQKMWSEMIGDPYKFQPSFRPIR